VNPQMVEKIVPFPEDFVTARVSAVEEPYHSSWPCKTSVFI